MIQDNITPIIVVLGALLVLAIALIIYLFWRTRRVEMDCEILVRDTHGQNFVEIVGDNIAQVEDLMGAVERLSDLYAQVLRRVAGAVQHVGVVRFDAFRDLGGLLSFAVAFLDDRGNGLVFSSIYGRSESRTYAKPVVERGSTYELSPEEREAIRLAMQSREFGALPVEARDREHEERMATLKLFHDKEYLERSNGRDVRGEEALETRPRRPTEDRRPPSRPEPAITEESEPEPATRARRQPPARAERSRRGPGRVSHVGAPERRPRSAPEHVDERPERPPERIPEQEKLPEEEIKRREAIRAPRRGSGTRQPEDADERATAGTTGNTSPPGLNTPVERLRGRKPRGER
jgi:hypothetical protein